jgi:hypothetical protein
MAVVAGLPLAHEQRVTVLIEHTWYEVLTAIVSAVNAVLLLGLLTALAFAAWSLRKTFRRVQATIESANGVLQRAIGKAETRVNDLNALLEVAQQEAEQAFVSTASLVRGVRSGASALRKRDADNEPQDDEGGTGDGDDDSTEGTERTARPRIGRRAPQRGSRR